MKKYLSQWTLSLDELFDIQKQELSLLLEEAYNYVPFYKKSFDNLNINLNGANGVSANLKTDNSINVDDDNVQFIIPDFSENTKKINFGKIE